MKRLSIFLLGLASLMAASGAIAQGPVSRVVDTLGNTARRVEPPPARLDPPAIQRVAPTPTAPPALSPALVQHTWHVPKPARSAPPATVHTAPLTQRTVTTPGVSSKPQLATAGPSRISPAFRSNAPRGEAIAQAARDAAKTHFWNETEGLNRKLIRMNRNTGTSNRVIGAGTKEGGSTFRPKPDGSYSVGKPGEVKHYRPDKAGGYTVNDGSGKPTTKKR